MWTRTYLFLLALRLYFALSPSYIHPDENFQGPEVIAGTIFGWPNHLSWEFTSDRPVRSVFPLWLVYGLPMQVMQWIWAEIGTKEIAPGIVYYTLRALMFVINFVLEDWALHELVQSPRHRRLAIVLVASSYVTWSYQTHTFSNSVETMIVLWVLVMVQRLMENKHPEPLLSPAILGFLLTFGVFNRVSFPAFTLVPCLILLPNLLRKPLSLLVLSSAITVTALIAVAQDTAFYKPAAGLGALWKSPVITPYNSLLYNSNKSNLETHGLHPHYQHILANLPQLLGPAILLVRSVDISQASITIVSALSGTFILSCIPHQEARFLLPAVPLIISAIHLPRSRAIRRGWLAAWIIFNAIFGVLMGTFHQGGIVPTQIWLAHNHGALNKSHPEFQSERGLNVQDRTTVLWWRTYPPPIWLLDHAPLETVGLMGIPLPELQSRLLAAVTPNTSSSIFSSSQQSCDSTISVGVVAPLSSLDLAAWQASDSALIWKEVHVYNRHLNLDDIDFATPERGIVGEIKRLFGRTGLGVWSVSRNCSTEHG